MKATYHALFGLLSIFLITEALGSEIKLEPIPNSKLRQGTIQQVLNVSHDELWNTINDIEKYDQYMPKMRNVKVLESDPNRVLYHAVISMPWPISNVEYDCDVFPSKNKDRIDFKMVDGSGKGVKTFYGYWEFKPISENKVDATYVLVFDSGRKYPRWAENLGLKSTLGNVMKNVQARVNKLRETKQVTN